ncbi:MAG: glucose-1-phosphate adenylyltransferase [Bacteroidetes bacterium]|nr:glucose-1-phosphate adenylyltransferase [Rhodothermia bacterium]MCS7155662.1 glucose-1-phosphate adenylyltransferase [Bacteroidota bacterium]MCX7906521.1 glucose-1-phosphate adenylyltransferase [Bacteroidota bacterium]MDW8137198.1 glucose-1-phosphate adenylyltransferase [Bacteroidota bacterium]MDW8284932.1 glucose-1-phosphate adenylyltransferase [Bacteroidota bacterium]
MTFKQQDVLAIILGGGAGTRLFPLTLLRSKPAVPLGGKYRLIDVPVSNCLNSGINRIFILTQYNSASLNRHINHTYRFSPFSRGFVDILAAEQTPRSQRWFQGTADAVRQSLHHFEEYPFRYALILSGDQLYQMDFRLFGAYHCERGAAITIATTPVRAEEAPGLGIMKTDGTQRIVRFVEKPPPELLGELESDTGPEMRDQGRRFLASMGIYLFNRDVLFDLLLEHPDLVDFGREVIPLAIERLPVYSYRFDGYWTDIGTIASFYEANLALTDLLPAFNLYDAERPLYTHARMLPPTKFQMSRVHQSIVAEGCILEGCDIEHSVIGIRSIIGPGTVIRDSIIMGADYYETPQDQRVNRELGRPDVGIGRNVYIERAIVDKNARIGDGVQIRNAMGLEKHDADFYYIRERIVIIPKNAIVPPGTVI